MKLSGSDYSTVDEPMNSPILIPSLETLFERSHTLAQDIEAYLPENKLNTTCQNIINSLKKNTLSRIPHDLKKLSLFLAGLGDCSPELSAIQNRIIFLQNDISERPRQVFRNKVVDYFSSHFGDTFQEMTFEDKKSGRQFGNKIIVKLKDHSTVPFYAKTHGQGMGSGSSTSSTHPVNPKELFIYKFLEFSHLGCQTHFFYDDIQNFYIATREAGFNEQTKKVEEVKTYHDVFSEMKNFTEKLDEEDEHFIDPIIIHGLVTCDLISRLFHLSDLTNNPENIVFTFLNKKIQDFKIIDFDVNDTMHYNNPHVYEGFISGNGVHLYAQSANALVRYFLAQRKLEKRIETARDIAKSSSIFTTEFIDQAYTYSRDYLEHSNLSFPPTAFKDLDNYVCAIKENIDIFRDRLESAS